MKPFIQILIFFFLFIKSYGQDYELIYKDYKETEYKAISLTNKVKTPTWNIGDTIKVDFEYRVYPFYDTIIWMDRIYPFPENTNLRILRSGNSMFEVEIIGDTVIGLIDKKELENKIHHGYYASEKTYFYDEYIERREMLIDSLKHRYSINDSILKLVIEKFEPKPKYIESEMF